MKWELTSLYCYAMLCLKPFLGKLCCSLCVCVIKIVFSMGFYLLAASLVIMPTLNHIYSIFSMLPSFFFLLSDSARMVKRLKHMTEKADKEPQSVAVVTAPKVRSLIDCSMFCISLNFCDILYSDSCYEITARVACTVVVCRRRCLYAQNKKKN